MKIEQKKTRFLKDCNPEDAEIGAEGKNGEFKKRIENIMKKGISISNNKS
jgi:hypothetical protein